MPDEYFPFFHEYSMSLLNINQRVSNMMTYFYYVVYDILGYINVNFVSILTVYVSVVPYALNILGFSKVVIGRIRIHKVKIYENEIKVTKYLKKIFLCLTYDKIK